jgi:hypothetical protein
MIANAEAAEPNEFDLASFDAVVFSKSENRSGTPRAVQIFAGVVVMVAHVGFWWVLQWISRPDIPLDADATALLIEFITRAPAEKVPPKAPSPMSKALPDRKVAPEHVTEIAARHALPAQTAQPPVTSPSLPLYNDDGSVRIPAEVLADLAKLRSDERSFDFQQPGLERAAKLLRHESPLEYQATRFDKYWQPRQDLLTEVLTKAVEASTKEIRIPIPGDQKHTLVCRVSLLAMGGGCGVESNDDYDGILAGHDDPDTLSAKEALACQAWWEKIIAAKTQDEWRQTRKLYDQECRKPLANEQLMPSEPIKAPSGP